MAKSMFGKEIHIQAAFHRECGLALRARFIAVLSNGRVNGQSLDWNNDFAGEPGGNLIPTSATT